MRNDAFVPLVMDYIKNTPGVSRVQTLEEAGDRKHPCGFAVTVGGKETHWQALHRLAEGERHDTPTVDIDGAPAPWADSAVQDVAAIERWSVREGNRPGHVGLTIHFHNGSRAFLRKI